MMANREVGNSLKTEYLFVSWMDLCFGGLLEYILQIKRWLW